jgi:hypothetical protein
MAIILGACRSSEKKKEDFPVQSDLEQEQKNNHSNEKLNSTSDVEEKSENAVEAYLPTPEEIEKTRKLEQSFQNREKEAVKKKKAFPYETEKEIDNRVGVETPLRVLPPSSPLNPSLDKTKRTRNLLRPLSPELQELLKYIQKNNIEMAQKSLLKASRGVLPPQDHFLLKTLEAYLSFRVGEDEKSLLLLSRLGNDLKKTLPLRLEKALLVEGPLRSIRFGRYKLKKMREFHRGETLFLYLQIENFVQKKDGDYWKLSFSVDFSIRDNENRLIHDLKDFDRNVNRKMKKNTNLNPRRDFSYACGVPIPREVNLGNYVLECRLKDLNSPEREAVRAQINFMIR